MKNSSPWTLPRMEPEFDRYAKTYATLIRDPIKDLISTDSGFFHRRKWMLIRDFLAKRGMASAALKWLDVGCGQGELLALAGTEFAEAVGCDPSRKMLETSVSTEVFGQDSAVELPFPDRCFDLVTAVCVYHHVPSEQRGALTQSIYRVLKPGGVFGLIEHNPWNPVMQLIVRRSPVDVDAKLLTSWAASRLMRAARLKVIETAYFSYLPERMFNRMAWIENSLRKCPVGGQFATFSQKEQGE